jgi:hypothetical protein
VSDIYYAKAPIYLPNLKKNKEAVLLCHGGTWVERRKKLLLILNLGTR